MSGDADEAPSGSLPRSPPELGACSECEHAIRGRLTPPVCPERVAPDTDRGAELSPCAEVIWTCLVLIFYGALLSGACGLWLQPGRRGGRWGVWHAISESLLTHSAVLLLGVFMAGMIWMARAKPSNRPRALYAFTWAALITVLLAGILLPVRAS